MNASELVPQMLELRRAGYSATAIGRHLGVPASTVRNWWNAGACSDCGRPTEKSNGRAAVRCTSCSHAYQRSEEVLATVTFWTRERIIKAIQWWVREYGEPPAMADWDPQKSIVRFHDLARTRRAERLIAERRIPWPTHVVKRFGSWNRALAAAGCPTRAALGTSENNGRRRSVAARRAVMPEAAPPTGRAEA